MGAIMPRQLRAGEIASLLKHALHQLADHPALVRAGPRSSRYLIIEKHLRQAPQVCGLLVDALTAPAGWLPSGR